VFPPLPTQEKKALFLDAVRAVQYLAKKERIRRTEDLKNSDISDLLDT
jgi:hypothetical protein